MKSIKITNKVSDFFLIIYIQLLGIVFRIQRLILAFKFKISCPRTAIYIYICAGTGSNKNKLRYLSIRTKKLTIKWFAYTCRSLSRGRFHSTVDRICNIFIGISPKQNVYHDNVSKFRTLIKGFT